ncbi:hypothetical protein R8Z50_05055 [Longispora sp. K20-0274]|uniref:aa3-type cytochrome oxidase subunit CtaJ n=1 Tax=Longispora sp. K20-0274 TaxID=3088255 RepID=UPI00399AE2BA
MFGYSMDTVLFVVGGALGVVALVYAIVYGASSRQAKRYRPGRSFEFAPVWFLAQPELLVTGQKSSAKLPALTGAQPAAAGTKGGASGKW